MRTKANDTQPRPSSQNMSQELECVHVDVFVIAPRLYWGNYYIVQSCYEDWRETGGRMVVHIVLLV